GAAWAAAWGGGWSAGAATPMMVCLPPPGSPGPLTGAGAGVAMGAAPTGAIAGMPSIVLFNLAGGCGAGADISGAMPTMVFFNDADGAFCRGASSGAGMGPLTATASAPFVGGSLSAAPHEAQFAASGWLDDPHRGQAIMGRAYHVEVAGRPEFEYPCGWPPGEGTTLVPGA